MKKGYSLTNNTNEIEKSYAIETTEADLAPLKEAKYDGNMYKIYNTAIPSNIHWDLALRQELEQNSDYFYWESGSGVVVSDMQLLEK